MPVFKNENVVLGLNKSGAFQVGKSNKDDGSHPEIGQQLPWFIDPETSYQDYLCWIESYLDAGIVVHRHLPQSAQDYDTLSTGDMTDPNFAATTSGVNMKSHGSWTNLVQRMANSHYRFCLRGYAIRVGYLPSVPALKFIGTATDRVPTIPDDQEPQQVVGPMIIGNNSGIPVYAIAWKIWYTIVSPPKTAPAAPTNLSEQIGQVIPVGGIQVPISLPDDDAVRAAPPQVRQNLGPLFDPLQQK